LSLLSLSEGSSSWQLELFERFNIPVPPGDRYRMIARARRDKERRARTHTAAAAIARAARKKAKLQFIERLNKPGRPAYERMQELRRQWIDDNSVVWATVPDAKKALLDKVLYQRAWLEVKTKTSSGAPAEPAADATS
jgi:hypothetical protein